MSAQSYQSRSLQEADLGQVISMDKEAGGEDRTDFFHKRIHAIQRSPEAYISIIISVDDRVCGFLLASVLTGEFGGTGSVAQIDTINVPQSERGQGIGTRLMNALKEKAQMAGCVLLRTQASWQHQELIAYFARAGFELAPRHILKRSTSSLHKFEEIDDIDATWLPPVRSLQTSDLNDILRIERHISGESREDYIKQKITEALADSGIRISLVGIQDDMVAGFIMARLDYGSFGLTSSTAVIDTIGVSPEYKGQGIASSLMSQLLDNLNTLQVEDVRTEVEWDNFELNHFLAGCDFSPAQILPLHCQL